MLGMTILLSTSQEWVQRRQQLEEKAVPEQRVVPVVKALLAEREAKESLEVMLMQAKIRQREEDHLRSR